MKYKGIELEEVTEPQVFNPPKPMLVWDADEERPVELNVCAIVNRNRNEFRVITERSPWKHCAKIPEIPEVLATNRELSRWLAEGKGQLRKCTAIYTIYTCLSFTMEEADESVDEGYVVSKWKDTEWHKPTREYLGLEG